MVQAKSYNIINSLDIYGGECVMENKLSIKIPLGYTIIKKSKKVDIWEAEDILTSKKRNKYTQAIRRDASAELIGDFLVCPVCNSHYVANSRNKMFNGYYSDKFPLNYMESLK